MARIPTFTPRSVTKNKRTYWDLDVPKAFDPNPDKDKKRRQRKRFETKTEALNAARHYRSRWRDLGKHGITLTPEQASEAHKAFKLIEASGKNLYLSSVIEEALKAMETLEEASLKSAHDLSLMKASKHLIKHYKETEEAMTFEEVYVLSVEARGMSEKTVQYQNDVARIMTGPKYKRGQKTPEDGYKEEGFLHHYGSTLIKDITEDQVRNFIHSYYNSSDYNWNICHRILGPVFKYAHERNWISLNPMKLIAKRRAVKDRPDILTIKQFNRCIDLIGTQEYRDIAIPVAIMMFAGLRPSELAGSQNKIPMAWDKVVMNPVGANASEPYIDVTKKHAKNKKPRLVKIVPNLVKWINTVRLSERKGNIVPSNFGSLMKKFRSDVGIVGMKDIFRHSFATYHYHAGENMDASMKQMGHSNRSTFENHYHAYNPEPNSPSLYWELLPEGAKEETKMVEPDFQSVAT